MPNDSKVQTPSPAPQTSVAKPLLRGTLLAASTLTIMAGATIAPGLPRMQAHFADVAQADLLVRLVLTIVALAVALFSPIAGWLADRFGRKPLLLFGLALYAVAGTSGLYLETLPALLLGRVLLGVAVSSITTASSALVADSFAGVQRTQFIGLQAAFTGFGGVLFLPLGGMLADIGWHAPFAVYFASLAILPFALWGIDEPIKATAATLDWVQPGIVRQIYVLALLQMIVFYIGPTQIPFLLQNVIGLAPSLTGYVVALFTLSSALTSLQYANVRHRLDERAVTVLGFALLGLGWFVFGLTQSLWVILGGMVVSGIGGGLLGPNFAAWLAGLAPAHARGRVLSGLSTSLFLGQFLSPILAQPFVSTVGLDGVFKIMGGLSLTVALAFWFLNRSARGSRS